MGKTISVVGVILVIALVFSVALMGWPWRDATALLALYRWSIDYALILMALRVLLMVSVFMHWTQVGAWLSRRAAKTPWDDERVAVWQAMRSRFIAAVVLLEGLMWASTSTLAGQLSLVEGAS